MEVCIRDLFVAGTDTATSSVSWLILGILNYPNYYKNIQDEIDLNIGKKDVYNLFFGEFYTLDFIGR